MPDGPLRDLVAALQQLHRDAGKPGVRRISVAIRERDDLRDTVSHETISAMLRGGGLPRWVKVECVVRQLAEWAVSPHDPDEEVRRFHRLWLAASDLPDTTDNVPPGELRRDFVRPPVPPDRHPFPTAPGLPAPGAAALITNLPARSAGFTGRDQLLREIREALNRVPHRPLALHGLGGVGKTQLAVEYVHQWSGEYDLAWWVPAEQQSQAMVALAALGERLDLPQVEDMRQGARAVLDALENSALRWIVIYDNADVPEDLAPLLPATGGHVVLTSRDTAWARHANALRVDVFTRAESVVFLQGIGNAGSPEDSNRLAEQLGDLPLALAQVRAMQQATGMPVAEYLRLFAEHMDELLATGRPTGSPTNVVTFVRLAFARLQSASPAAAQLLESLAFMAPEPVSLALLRSGRDGEISPPLGRALYQPEALERIAHDIERFGLARLGPDMQRIQVHRLVQLVLRESLPDEDSVRIRADVHRLLAAANPGDPDWELTWPMHAEIGPHLIASEAVTATLLPARAAVVDQIRYLERIGHFEASVQLGRATLEILRKPPQDGGLGPDHELTFLTTRHLANALLSLSRYAEAEPMIFQTLDALQDHPQYGADHSVTLAMATIAAYYLRITGSYRDALTRDEDRVGRLRRIYGEEHERTLTALHHLAVNLRLTGNAQRALEIDAKLVETLQTSGRGSHPLTLLATGNLARDLFDLGRYREARDLQRQYLREIQVRQVRPVDPLRAERTIAVALRKLGDHGEAVRLTRQNYQDSQLRFGPDHELTLAAIMSYANALRAVGDAVGARSLAIEALERYRRIFGEQNPLTLAAAANLAVILRALGRWREAHQVDERTLDEMRRALGPEHPYALVVATGLATDLAHNRAYEAARSLGEQTLEASHRVRGSRHPDTWACAANVALDRTATGDVDGGEALRGEAAATLRRLLGSEHPDVYRAGRGERIDCDIEPPPT